MSALTVSLQLIETISEGNSLPPQIVQCGTYVQYNTSLVGVPEYITLIASTVPNNSNIFYTWTKDNEVIAQNIDRIDIPVARSAGINTYRVNARNSLDETGQCSLVVLILNSVCVELPCVPLNVKIRRVTMYRCCDSATNNNTEVYDCGSNIEINSLEENVLVSDISGGTTPYEITWELPDGSILNSEPVNINTCGTYTLTANDAGSNCGRGRVVCSVNVTIVKPTARVITTVNCQPPVRNNKFIVDDCNLKIESKFLLENYPCERIKYDISKLSSDEQADSSNYTGKFVECGSICSGEVVLINNIGGIDTCCTQLEECPLILRFALYACNNVLIYSTLFTVIQPVPCPIGIPYPVPVPVEVKCETPCCPKQRSDPCNPPCLPPFCTPFDVPGQKKCKEPCEVEQCCPPPCLPKPFVLPYKTCPPEIKFDILQQPCPEKKCSNYTPNPYFKQ